MNLLDVEGVIVGGGLGVRLGDPYAQRIAEAMQPHLFVDCRPPHVHVAALGDLGGAIGAALLVIPSMARRRDGSRSRRNVRSLRGTAGRAPIERSCAAHCSTARESGSAGSRT